jgi:hypothetical protein
LSSHSNQPEKPRKGLFSWVLEIHGRGDWPLNALWA